MKDKKIKSEAKEARKTLKKQLNEKIAAQLKTVIGEFESDLKKVSKTIEKASKNLAKTLAAKISGNKPVSEAKVPAAKKAKATLTDNKIDDLPLVKPVTDAKPAAKATKVGLKDPAKKAAGAKGEAPAVK